MRIALLLLLVATTGCTSQASLSDDDRRAVMAEVSTVLEAMNDAWRRGDNVAANQALRDDGVLTFNGARMPTTAAKAAIAQSAGGRGPGQYIGEVRPRHDVLSRDLVVTTFENDFARRAADGTQEPMQVGLMTLLWTRTPDGWRILHYHESTRPQSRQADAASLAPYVGTYVTADGAELRFTSDGGALHLSRGAAQPMAMQAFTDPDFGAGESRITFVRDRDGRVQGVLEARVDGSSVYAWRR
jgi:ketosteroid isomerase-like protein